jgi:hypothetical protein
VCVCVCVCKTFWQVLGADDEFVKMFRTGSKGKKDSVFVEITSGNSRTLVDDMTSEGYTTRTFHLDGEDFFIPQARKRFYWVSFLNSAVKDAEGCMKLLTINLDAIRGCTPVAHINDFIFPYSHESVQSFKDNWMMTRGKKARKDGAKWFELHRNFYETNSLRWTPVPPAMHDGEWEDSFPDRERCSLRFLRESGAYRLALQDLCSTGGDVNNHEAMVDLSGSYLILSSSVRFYFLFGTHKHF